MRPPGSASRFSRRPTCSCCAGTRAQVRAHGLSLGGLLEPGALIRVGCSRRASALLWALGLAAIIFPLFWIGFVLWWHPPRPCVRGAHLVLDDVLGQVMVIALPEEAFYRGYVQPALERLPLPKQGTRAPRSDCSVPT